MAIESNSIFNLTDPGALGTDLNDVVRPALEGLGALEVRGGLALTGPMTGMGVLSSRWESLGAWAASQAASEAPGSPLAEVASRYQLTQRLISQDLHEAGTTSGDFLTAVRFSFTSAPQGLENAANVTVSAGAKGVRILSVLAGGDMTGHLIGAVFLDSLDQLPDVVAAGQGDPQFMADMAAAGGQLQSRTLFRLI